MLERHVEHLLTLPENQGGGKPIIRYHDFEYQAAGGAEPRRMGAKVTRVDLLFQGVGPIVTKLNWGARRVVEF